MPLARDLKLIPGNPKTGPLNSLNDVPGVLVGHHTLLRENIASGVTAILPHGDNLFREKVPAAVHVINGFGKSAGLMQIEEIGSIESPILITNTFGIGTCCNALIRRAIRENPEIARTTSTFNPAVFECNDGYLSDIQSLPVTEEDALLAISAACDNKVEQGCVGAGTGMRCFGFKGGLGTTSRIIELDGKSYTFGLMVNTNFGSSGMLVLPDGRRPTSNKKPESDKGSVIIVMATDIPLETRQIKRIAKRCAVGLARLGSIWGHESGDIVVGFSTSTRIHHYESNDLISMRRLAENKIETLFNTAADCTVEAVLNSLTMATEVKGRNARTMPLFMDWFNSQSK